MSEVRRRWRYGTRGSAAGRGVQWELQLVEPVQRSLKRGDLGERWQIVCIPRFFVGCGGRLLGAACKEKLGEGDGVIFSSLCRKSEENEEDESTNDAGPLGKRQTDHYQVVTLPDDGRYLPDPTEMVMRVFPADPRFDRGRGRVDHH